MKIPSLALPTMGGKSVIDSFWSTKPDIASHL
jgi:hypothetical protein